jgi:glycosyltransferase involved in cell wall biosynthesis
MKIGIEVQRLFRRKKHGMEIVALEIIRQLQKTDKKNEYILFAKNDEDKDCITESKKFHINIPSNSCFPVWEQLHLLKAVKKEKPDILHCTANTAPLFCKIPMVITIHDVIYLESINFSGTSYQNFGNLYRRFIVPKVAKKAAMILTVSEYEKKVIVDRLNIDEDKVRVVYNGVNKQLKPITNMAKLSEFRKKYNLPEQFLLHFANTAPKKNTIGVLSAYKLYHAGVSNPLPLVLTDCTGNYIHGLLKKLNAPGLIDNIQILDYVPFSSIPCLYNLATVFIYPSHRESFGMPLIEAMACGVPVITSNTSALPEIAGGAACLVDPKNPHEISDQIQRLLTDERFYKERKDKGFRNAERFSWEKAADKIESVYWEIRHVNKSLEECNNLRKNMHKYKTTF